MNTNHAAYWVAVGALALGLSSDYQRGNFVTLHQVAKRAGSAVCQVASSAKETLALAKILTSRGDELASESVAAVNEARVAQAQGEMLAERARDEAQSLRDRSRGQLRDEIRARAAIIRARAEMARAQEEVRLRTRAQLRLVDVGNRGVMVVCPKTGTRLDWSRAEDGPVGPEIEVGDTF